jgi:flagellar basal-body rod protein FlgB
MPTSLFNNFEGAISMDSISATILLKAMDGLSMRAEVTAQNIANANSPGYRPLKVNFEDSLRAAASGTRDSIRQVKPTMGLSIDEAGRSELRLDLEMATAASTAGRYGTLAELLNRRLQIEALAAAGSR